MHVINKEKNVYKNHRKFLSREMKFSCTLLSPDLSLPLLLAIKMTVFPMNSLYNG